MIWSVSFVLHAAQMAGGPPCCGLFFSPPRKPRMPLPSRRPVTLTLAEGRTP